MAKTSFFFHSLIPLTLMIVTSSLSVPLVNFVILNHCDYNFVNKVGFVNFLVNSWKAADFFDREVLIILSLFCLWSGLSLFLPGRIYKGPLDKTGNTPLYHDSGFRYYLMTLVTMALLLLLPTSVSYYDLYLKIVPLSSTLVLFSLGFTLFLYLKGLWFPSPGEHGPTGSLILDIYWGRELYPRIGKWFDIKLWTNSRFGLMAWLCLILLAWRAQYEQTGWNGAMAVSALLQTIYLGKFYWWESGYMNSLDIILDRAGYYLCWGCLCFVPTFYTLASFYMVEHSPHLPLPLLLALFAWGISCTLLTYWVDYQRTTGRTSGGTSTIWGKKPHLIPASYIDSSGKERKSFLLASGFWGLSRHPNYLFEFLADMSWTLPAATINLIPWLHVIFLFILLVHRSGRDHSKCQEKYGEAWSKYCSQVPYKIIPGIY